MHEETSFRKTDNTSNGDPKLGKMSAERNNNLHQMGNYEIIKHLGKP